MEFRVCEVWDPAAARSLDLTPGWFLFSGFVIRLFLSASGSCFVLLASIVPFNWTSTALYVSYRSLFDAAASGFTQRNQTLPLRLLSLSDPRIWLTLRDPAAPARSNQSSQSRSRHLYLKSDECSKCLIRLRHVQKLKHTKHLVFFLLYLLLPYSAPASPPVFKVSSPVLMNICTGSSETSTLIGTELHTVHKMELVSQKFIIYQQHMFFIQWNWSFQSAVFQKLMHLYNGAFWEMVMSQFTLHLSTFVTWREPGKTSASRWINHSADQWKQMNLNLLSRCKWSTRRRMRIRCRHQTTL